MPWNFRSEGAALGAQAVRCRGSVPYLTQRAHSNCVRRSRLVVPLVSNARHGHIVRTSKSSRGVPMAAKRYSLIFYAAIVVALISTFSVYRVLEKMKTATHVAMGPVVVAQKDMAEGAAVDRMAVAVAQWPVHTI